jgi:ComF family protein
MLARILDLLFPVRADEKTLRGISSEAFCARLTPYEVPAMRPAAVGLALYSDPLVRAAIHEAKYHGSRHAFNLLAALLADFLPEYLADSLDTQVGRTRSYVVIPVPLGKARRRERGYNQVEEVARRALSLLGDAHITLDTTLIARTRETKTQVSLPRNDRERNMKGAFKAMRAPEAHTSYIILDDVLTTGATLGECVEALATAGASREHILPLALAYQP